MVDPFIKQILRSESNSPLPSPSGGWDGFYPDIVAHGLAPALHLLAGPRLPEPIARLALRAYRDALLFKDFCVCKLQHMQPELASCGRIVVIKGLALCESMYKEPWIRPMSDVDLYFPDGSVAEARKILAENGFKNFGSYSNEYHCDSFHIDLHEDLWGVRRNPVRRSIASGIAESFEQSTLMPGFLTPSKDLLAAHCAFHTVKHGFSRGIWLMDLIKLHQAGCFAAYSDGSVPFFVSFALNYLAAMGLVPAGDVVSPHVPRLRRLLLSRIISWGERFNSGELALSLLCPTLRQSVAYLCASLVPRREILCEMYGNRSYLRLASRRFADLAFRRTRFLPGHAK